MRMVTEGGGESSLISTTFWEAEQDLFFVLVNKGYFVIKHAKSLTAPTP